MSEIEIRSKKLVLNQDELTFGDFEDFEEYTGKTIEEAFTPIPALDSAGKKIFDERGRPEMYVKYASKDLVALVWIIGRKDDPKFSLDDARSTKVSELIMGATADPKESEEKSN